MPAAQRLRHCNCSADNRALTRESVSEGLPLGNEFSALLFDISRLL
jgi:hypothetical protein